MKQKWKNINDKAKWADKCLEGIFGGHSSGLQVTKSTKTTLGNLFNPNVSLRHKNCF